MRGPPYGILMQDGHGDELKETLIAKVTEMATRLFKELSQEAIDRIPQVVEAVVHERIPASGPDTSDDGGRSYLYCEDCHGAPCCFEPEIAVTIFDASKLANALGISRKKFIKEHLARYEGESPASTNVAVYVLKRVNPCEFLDENARCRVYEARPLMCRWFPFRVSDGDDGKLVLTNNDYCNYGFNMMKYQCYSSLILEEIRARFPEEYERIESQAQPYLHTENLTEEDYLKAEIERNEALQTLAERFVRPYDSR